MHLSGSRNTIKAALPHGDWADLLSRVVQADQSALAAFYDKSSRMVYGVALRILSDPSAAEEVTLDVYMRVWSQAGTYDSSRGSPLAWLMTIARNKAIDRLRNTEGPKRHEQPLEEFHTMIASGDNPETTTALAEGQLQVRQALRRLSPEQREVIEIAYFRGLSQSEIAEKLEIPVGTVKTRMRTGMLKLREFLRPLQEAGLF